MKAMADVCLLGCGGIMPLPDRWLSSLLIRHEGKMILFDCGEGTQIPLKQAGWGFKAIDAVCFSHYHADHISGLPGLLLTLGNGGRTQPLNLFGPTGLRQVINGLTVISPQLPFELVLNELPTTQKASYKIGGAVISSFPADHGIPCLCYTFEIERPGLFLKDKAQSAGIPVNTWNRLQNGETVTLNGSVFSPGMVLGPHRKGIKVGFCTDSRPAEGFSDFFRNSDLLVCEGLYGDSSLEKKAYSKGHMIFSQAAAIARRSGCKELWLTHFSPAMKNPEDYIGEAKSIFENTLTGNNLMKTALRFKD